MDYLELFHKSYKRILQSTLDDKDFFEVFYHKFVSSSALVKEKFRNTDMKKQKSMLKDSLLHLLDFFATHKVDDYMLNIARIHSKSHHDISPELYDLWLDSLVSTLQEFDPDFNSNIELAWRIVLSPGITFMKFHYTK